MSKIKDRTGILSTGVKVISYAESKNKEYTEKKQYGYIKLQTC